MEKIAIFGEIQKKSRRVGQILDDSLVLPTGILKALTVSTRFLTSLKSTSFFMIEFIEFNHAFAQGLPSEIRTRRLPFCEASR